MDGRLCGLDLAAALCRASADIDRAALAELLTAGEAGVLTAAHADAEREG